VPARVRAGQRGGVVGKGHAGEACDAAAAERGAVVHELRNVRQVARLGHRVEHVRVRAVPEEADDVVGLLGRIQDVGQRFAVLRAQDRSVERLHPAQHRECRRHVDHARLALDASELLDAFARDDQRGARLDQIERAALFPVVRRRVHNR